MLRSEIAARCVFQAIGCRWPSAIAWAVLLLACGETSGGRPASESKRSLCAREELYFPARAANLTPSDDFDYLAVRMGQAAEATGTTERWVRTDFQTLSEAGRACETAATGTCMDEVAHHPLPFVSTSCAMVCTESSIVTTKGDTVTRWTGPEQILALLGTIDTDDEALLVVDSNGYSVWCPGDGIPGYPEDAVPEIQVVDDGFEVIATKVVKTCPVVLRRFRLRVRASGEIEELEMRDLPWAVCG